MEREEKTFGAIDYCSFAAMLTVSIGIGVYTSFKGNKSSEDFLMGNRAFSPFPVAMSLVTSFVSAISLLGFSGEAYANGLQLSLFLTGMIFGIGAAGLFILPVLHPLTLTSVNEYLELRFKSSLLRKLVTSFVVVQGLLYMGICLYAPTIALSTVTPLSSFAYIFILGIVVTFYSAIGGIRAVIWTDVFQLTVMILGLIVIFIIGTIDAGGPTKIYNVALAGGRLDMSNFNPSIYERHTVYNTLSFGFFSGFAYCGVSQTNVQRICAVQSMSDSKKVLWLTALGMIVTYILIFGGGVIAYAAYAGCDPMLRGEIKKKEEVIPFYILDRLSYVVGLPGLFVATIIGGALSSLSSVISALVAMLWKDCLSCMKMFEDMNPQKAGFVNKLLSVLIGVLFIGTAILASKGGSLIEFTNSVGAVMLGGTLGVFILGLFFPKVNMKGVWAGFIVATILLGWISIGTFFYGKPAGHLPFSDDNCSSIEFNITDYKTNRTEHIRDFENLTGSQQQYDFPMMYLYGISYTLYKTIGSLVCILVGVLVSLCTGNQDISEVDPRYVSPFVRRFFWDKKDLEAAFSKQTTPKTAENGHIKETNIP